MNTEEIPLLIGGEVPSEDQMKAVSAWVRTHPGLWQAGTVVTSDLANHAIMWVNEARLYLREWAED